MPEKFLALDNVEHRSVMSSAGVFVSSWLGGLLLQVADWIIKKLPLIKHIYSAAKQARSFLFHADKVHNFSKVSFILLTCVLHACIQVSGAVNPANESTASFRECVLIRHPRHGEYAFAFITGTTVLQVCVLHLLPNRAVDLPDEDLIRYPGHSCAVWSTIRRSLI